ncbi:FUSC family protein, partial [Enterococcus faecalis]|nr:FUSC family protein [Enterococcus faecalis]
MAASMIFGLETSLYLRILLNMLGLAYGLLYHFVFVKTMSYCNRKQWLKFSE